MRRSVAVVIGTAAIALLLSSCRRLRDEACVACYELWLALQPWSKPPAPSIFAAWLRLYGAHAVDAAIRAAAVNNELTPELVNGVLLIRSQQTYVRVDEALKQRAAERGEKRWHGAA